MRTYLFFGYREWATNIYQQLSVTGGNWKLITTDKFCTKEIIDDIKPDMIFFVGWSWIVPKEIIDGYYCYCIHPSPLPKYRGGSPIQNQIINGETKSAVTLFRMNNDVDSGHIIKQEEFSLEGYLEDILPRITYVSVKLINSLIQDYDWLGCVLFKAQNEEEATYYRRRRPEDSELAPFSFMLLTAKQIYDMVRCLQSPYPEVSIKCKEGRLILEKVRYEL
jgi:methionyl-tRNA formyltransferase